MAGQGQDSDQEKTEDPTPRRREEARKEGQVPRSQELGGAVLLLFGSLALARIGGGAMARESTEMLHESTRWLRAEPLGVPGAVSMLRTTTGAIMLAILPFLGILGALALGVGLLQSRGVVSTTGLTPKLSHIDPLSGFKRLFSTRSVFALVKSVAKFIVIGVFAYTTIRNAWVELSGLGLVSETELLGVLTQLSLKLVMTTGLAFFVVTVVDYGFEVYKHEQGLRMTKQEVIEEHKNQEGNPQVKGRLRALGQAMVRKRMLGDVAKADVVVTNPTHIAVALKYDPLASAAPIVLAMGERKLAERIKALAKESGVPTVENRPLARALLATATVGHPIPTDLFTAVAEVLAYVYRRRSAAGRGGNLAGATH